MAIAGLHNVPILESSILRESQSSSAGRNGSISTRASSILQMWRELEDECAVNRARERGRPRLHQERNVALTSFPEGEGRGVGVEDTSESENGSVVISENHSVALIEQDDHRSTTSEQSQDFGDNERERVRKIFREWMSCGGNAETPRAAQINRVPRNQCVGQNERERVRIVSDWIQTNSQQNEECSTSREDQVAEIGSQIEQVQDGPVLEQNLGQPETNRRQIRKLCGRQALLDLIAKKEQERRQELQLLEGTRRVTGFAHRNRIQSVFRLRSFQNMMSAEPRTSSTVAQSELGLLRQRQTVSGLRCGFQSRLDNNTHVQASESSDSPSENNVDAFRDDLTQANHSNEVVDAVDERNGPANEMLIGAREEIKLKEVVDVGPSTPAPSCVVPSVCASTDLNQETTYSGDETNLQQAETQVETRLDYDVDIAGENRPGTSTTVHSDVSFDHGSPQRNPLELLRIGSAESTVLEERPETFHEHDSDREEIHAHTELDDQIPLSEDVIVNNQESSMPVEDWTQQVSEYERDWEGSALSNQWRGDQIQTEGNNWHGDAEDLSHIASESQGGEQNDVQEDFWHDNGSQETPRDWLGVPSGSGLASDRVDSYYFSDDDNVYHIELRELVNRRRVSSLLHSDFRDSLDQLIQSYVERQTNAPDDWELHEMLPPPYMARNRDQLPTDQEESESDDIHAGGREPSMPTPPPPPPQGHWRQWSHQNNRARPNIQQRPGTDWEIINDLRIDMARLQQRMNNMQRMLEACMDMQLELQRSVRQEVSAALNRPVLNSAELPENAPPKESFNWVSGRKGRCCICSNTNIDSLLYRCGHMCTCKKCADVLLHGDGKCPMCQAPVIEVIRAYFIQ